MNKFLFLLLFIFSVSPAIHCQQLNTTSKIVTKGDLLANNYPKDTTANAFYIFEEGFSQIDRDKSFDLVTNYQAKIKILNKEGFDHATIEIPLSVGEKSKEKIENLKAYTMNLVDGKQKQTLLSESEIFTEENNRYEVVKFTFPDVKPGSVIVYSYDLVSPYIFNFQPWYFQEDIPKEFSKFTAKIPGNYEYYVTKVGDLEFTSSDTEVIKRCIEFSSSASMADCVQVKYIMKDIPAFKSEKYLTAAKNFKSRLKFELIQITQLDGRELKYTKTWKDVDKELASEDLGRQLGKARLMNEVLPEDVVKMPLGKEKAEAIFQFVRNNYNWNGEYRVHSDMRLKDVLKDKTGNVLAINALLHNLYENEGFEVLPVLASTRNNGFPSKVHPVLSDFNYFFVQLTLEDKVYFLDATEDNLDFGRLPFRALNNYARLMDFENGSSWIDIESKDFSQITYNDSIKIHENGESSGFSNQRLTGYHALQFRDDFKNTSNKEMYVEFANPMEHTRAQDVQVEHLNSPEEVLKIRYSLTHVSQKINDRIYVNPFSFYFFQENPFKLDNRNYPIDFGFKDAYNYSAIIEIPENYTIEEIPENKVMALSEKDGRLIFSVNKISDSLLALNCRLTFKSTIYSAAYYEGLKRFFDEIINVQNQSLIVLKENG